jgi:hypothetical protein
MTKEKTVKIHELSSLFAYRCVQAGTADADLDSAYTSDLLSDVLANGTGKSVLITIQAHKNAVAVCSMTDIPAMVVCNNRPIAQDMIDAAAAEEIALYVTDKDQFTVSGELYARLGGGASSAAGDAPGAAAAGDAPGSTTPRRENTPGTRGSKEPQAGSGASPE